MSLAEAPKCEAFQHQTDCVGGNGCSTITRGINCRTSSGTPCQSGAANCTCERYEYDRCEGL